MFIYSNTRWTCQPFFSRPPIRSSEVVSNPWIMAKSQGVPRIKTGATTAGGAQFRQHFDTGVRWRTGLWNHP